MHPSLVLAYSICDLLLALQISISNFVVLVVYIRSRHIRTPTNAYIFSLAATDFLTGAFGIPVTVLSVQTARPTGFIPCLAVHLILCILCTVSTFHLLAMAFDKFLTICCKGCRLFPNHQQHSSRHARAKLLIALAWTVGIAIAALPLYDAFGFASATRPHYDGKCRFVRVVDYRYLVYVIFFATIIVPSIVIAFCYTAIYLKIRVEEKNIKCLLGTAERQRRIRNRRKLIRILLLLVLTYATCWYPLYILNSIDFFMEEPTFHPVVTLIFVILSHVSCLLNPLIYAYGMPGFKQSLRKFFFLSAANALTTNRSTLRRDPRGNAAKRTLGPTPTTQSVMGNGKFSVKSRAPTLDISTGLMIGTPSLSPRRFSGSLLIDERFSVCSLQQLSVGKASSRASRNSQPSSTKTPQLLGKLGVNAEAAKEEVLADIDEAQAAIHEASQRNNVPHTGTPSKSEKSTGRAAPPRWRLIPALRASLSSASKHGDSLLRGRLQSLPTEETGSRPRRKFAFFQLAKRSRPFFLADQSQPSTSGTMDSELAAAAASARKRRLGRMTEEAGSLLDVKHNSSRK